jgi:hypothetical protein
MDEKRETPKMTVKAVRNGLGNLICSLEYNGLTRRTLCAADQYLLDYEKDRAVLEKMAQWLANDCNEDICKLCVHEEEAEEATRRTGQDIPEDVEPCIFKRENGCKACVKGIIEFFKTKK